MVGTLHPRSMYDFPQVADTHVPHIALLLLSLTLMETSVSADELRQLLIFLSPTIEARRDDRRID